MIPGAPDFGVNRVIMRYFSSYCIARDHIRDLANAMTFEFEELDFRDTPLGELSLRRRAEPRLGGQIVYEVKLGEEFLMSSLFTSAEIELARLGLTALAGQFDDQQHGLDVVVGGLGLGYTAAAVLEDLSVATLTVIELLQPVIEWHRQGLVPLGKNLAVDPRCTLVHADFFKLATSDGSFYDELPPKQQAHAVLLDIDHSPCHWLDSENSAFYTASGLHKLANKLHPGGVFGLWSNDPPDDSFKQLLDSIFHSSEALVITFPNPYTDGQSSNTIYLAHTERQN